MAEQAGSSGLIGTLKMLAALVVIVVGALAILLVLDVLPRDAFREVAVKAVIIVGIVAAVSGAVAFLARSR